MITEPLNRLTKHVCSKLRILGFTSPGPSVMRALLDAAYFASIKTEENQFVRSSLTYSDPGAPELDPPICRRADYPSFTAFGRRTPLDAGVLVKLSRAVDRWSGSIAVYGTKRSDLFIWGIVDQQVQRNIRLNREAMGGFVAPGIVTVNIDGVGDVSGYHGDLFLGRLRQNQIILRENDALYWIMVSRRVDPVLAPAAMSIALALGKAKESSTMSNLLFEAWTDTVSRICIGLRRLGTGGSLLITPAPIASMLDVVHRFRYRRLGDSTILNVLDAQYYLEVQQDISTRLQSVRELIHAQADAEDRADELTGAVKVVTSLAAADGLVLMDLSLRVVGFGVKIRAGRRANTVYDGPDFTRKRSRARKINASHFGTRHGSMLRYCQADRNAIGIVVSQDGHTRLITSVGQSLTLWDDVMLLGHENNVGAYALAARRYRRMKSKIRDRRSLGFTTMPKSVRALLSYDKK